MPQAYRPMGERPTGSQGRRCGLGRARGAPAAPRSQRGRLQTASTPESPGPQRPAASAGEMGGSIARSAAMVRRRSGQGRNNAEDDGIASRTESTEAVEAERCG